MQSQAGIGQDRGGGVALAARNGLAMLRPGRYGLALLLCAASPAAAQGPKTLYPAMAPLAQYQAASLSEEIALARSAAPPSISGGAEVLTLGSHGYETAAKGQNGFACYVQRSWAAGFNDAEFRNPRLRAPICLNPAAVRTILPGYLERTKWVLAGVPKPDMVARTKAALAAKTFVIPESGAMGFMMSKQQYLSDAVGHWHPHLMFFLANIGTAAWGANLHDSPVFGAQGDPEPVTTFFVPIAKWSDGTPAAMQMH